MPSRTRMVVVVALALTLTACASGGASTQAPSSSSPSQASPPSAVTAAPTVKVHPSPTAVPPPTYPMDVMTVPDFAPLEVETYYVDPVGTDMRVFYTIPAEGWMQWFGGFKWGLPTDPPDSGVGLSILNVTNVVQDGCTGHVSAYPAVGPTVDDMATALATLKPFELLEPPTAVTAYGFSGMYLALAVPDIAYEEFDDGNKFTDCTDGELWSWIGAPLSYAYHAYSYPGQVEAIWLLDVEGTRLMIVAGTSRGSNDAHIAELHAVLDSIEIVP